MPRRASYPILLIAAVIAFCAVPARADDASTPCRRVEQELDACRRATAEARSDQETAEHEAATCKEDLATASTKIQQGTDATKACQKDRDHVCSATAAFVDELTKGRSRGAHETGCVSAEEQARLDGVVASWTSTSSWLTQLAAYQSGDSDTFPRPRPGAVDRSVHRLAANEGRGFERRLIVRALELVAPTEWARIRAGGVAAIDKWFASTEPLDATIVSEAERSSATASGLAGPPLTAALHLVDAFQLSAQCRLAPLDTGECARAHQIQLLLESTGSLVVRRRVQEIWATECNTITADTVAPWVEDFPAGLGSTSNSWSEIGEAAQAKLFACYLDDATAHVPYGGWMESRLPSVKELTATRLQRVDAIRKLWSDSSREAACARAVRAMQTITVEARCEVPGGDFNNAVSAWIATDSKLAEAGPRLVMCSEFARLLWEGKAPSIDESFTRPPSIDEMVATSTAAPPTPMSRLREQCRDRRGSIESFPTSIATLAKYARGFGEGPERPPFRVDAESSKPVELVRFEASQGARPWLDHIARETSSCTVLGLDEARCTACATEGPSSAYDCALASQLELSWSKRTSNLLAAAAILLAAILGATWLRRLRHARRSFASWAREAAAFFDSIGLQCRPDPWRVLLPSRFDALGMTLPSDPAWERWGPRAVLIRALPGRRVLERDVNHAAFVARRLGASVAVLEHDDDASPDLSAIRAMLEWAAKGGTRAIQILPISASRVRWSKSASDLLDLVEESSLRGNPFELRGRIGTSTQFFNRERLVSGLLAAAQAGHWVVVTGLRRFGKSSLTLEVARRLPGPTAYVDVSGFDHEVAHRADPNEAVEAMLRFVCMRLVESARDRWPKAQMPEPVAKDVALDAATLTQWFRTLSRACRDAAGHTPPLLIVLDELEQALAVGPEKLGHALDVLAILVGRLKSAVGESAMGVFLTSALHPLLWAPLRTLAHQSIMGSFQRVCVPCLGEDAASTMMRSLGARHGVRFSDAALSRMVEESQGVPLLLRRLGSSVLELYDAERARQGSLGAVDIGIEGTTEAIAREEREGSPLRVWVESEIAPAHSATGALLYYLAREESVPVTKLCTLATEMVAADFAHTGIENTLPPRELARRAEEAGHVIVQLLHESGLLVPHGDLTSPDAYSLPEGAIRRVLRARDDISAFPNARPEPSGAPTEGSTEGGTS